MPHGPTRILYCETNVDGTIGGSYYSLLYLVKGLDRARYMPVVVFYANHGLLGAFRDAGIETIVWPKNGRFTFGSRVPAGLGVLRAPIVMLQKALNVFRGFVLPTIARTLFLLKHRIDIVHLNNSILYNHDWMLAARIARCHCLSHERGINEHYPQAAKYWGSRLDAIICISEAVRTAMAAAGADFGNLHTVHNGFDPVEARREVSPAEVRQQLGIDPAADTVVMIGNLKAWKGQETLVQAIDLVRRSRPSVRCVIVGATSPSDREFEQTLRSLIASLGVGSNVILAGYRKNVADFLAIADVVVHASILPEPFGRVVLEAMACRKPVIGSRAGGVPEIIDEGITGLTFPPGDATALGEAISQVLGDPARAQRMGEAGYQRLQTHFHIDRNVEATERIYDRLVSQSVDAPGPSLRTTPTS